MGYLARGEDGSVFYDAAGIEIDGVARTQEWARRDKRHFRIILAADEAERLKDLRPFVREVMARAEQTLGRKLEWIAVDHFETDNPHTHIILRGRTAEASSTGGAPVTNIRNLASPHWRAILGPAHRCLVPFTAFSEYDDASPKGAKQIRWFAPRDRGLLMFAGIWRSWTGDYGSKKEPNEGKHLLFSFLTTEPNDIVRPIHAKAMPFVLVGRDAQEEWLSAPADRIADIQARPIANDALEVLDEEEASAYGGAYIK
jgi:putative SOS response-associated peptidase YedK